MPLQLQDLEKTDSETYPYIISTDVSIPLKTYGNGVVRTNVYRPKTSGRFPVLVTYGPYGKDVHYSKFRAESFAEVNPDHHSAHSAWETPDPGWWTARGYAIVRADERGIGNSPGVLDVASKGTSESFFDVVEWASEQEWSNGKVGLTGVSYYASSQWRVAARQPKGLAAMIPWEGTCDAYRDRFRHGGIHSNKFTYVWWHRQVIVNQYGGPCDANRAIPESIEGRLTDEELKDNLHDQIVETARDRFRDDEYHRTREYDLETIQVPLLSVANWGGSSLHLRGNVFGYMHAGSKLKYLRFIVGRHDLPYYYSDEAELQKSFLDAFLKGDDKVGWSTGELDPVSILLREGDVGYNDAEKESMFQRRLEPEWPLQNTRHTRYYLTRTGSMEALQEAPKGEGILEWQALEQSPKGVVQFSTPAFASRTEYTGHVTAHLNVSVSSLVDSSIIPSDLDLFVSLRHISAAGTEVFYTGSGGNPIPISKGWLRCSLRKTNPSHPYHRTWLPYREYLSTDVEPLEIGHIYSVDVEIWPTNVVVDPGAKLVFEISGADTQGAGMFEHNDPNDRKPSTFEGLNRLHFGTEEGNYVILPLIPDV